MFESDDYDQVLSQFEFPEECTNLNLSGANQDDSKVLKATENTGHEDVAAIVEREGQTNTIPKQKAVEGQHDENRGSPKHLKRKMINAYFNNKNKRKFPGPAGLLTNSLQENKDETIYQMELLSQDVDFSQNNLRGDLFQSPLWIRLSDDLNDWNLKDIDSIKTIKQEAMTGSLRRRKARTVTVFVESIDRSVKDPLIIMCDTTGNIKGTLHRDIWSAFSQYITSEYCAFILWRPTILTTGAAFKKHYLNITLSNLLAIYSSTVLNEEIEKIQLPEGYSIVYDDEYTVIRFQNSIQNIEDSNLQNTVNNDSNDLLDGLDSIFSDDIF